MLHQPEDGVCCICTWTALLRHTAVPQQLMLAVSDRMLTVLAACGVVLQVARPTGWRADGA